MVVSYRVDGNPKQKTTLNLGQHFTIPQDQWPRLTQMIEDDLRGVPRLPMEDPVLERTGKDLVEKLKAQGFDIHDPRDDRDAIMTHEIEHIDSRTCRIESLLGFEKILKTLEFSQNQIHWAMGLVTCSVLAVNCKPDDGTLKYFRLTQCHGPESAIIYNVGDRLFGHHETIMNEL